MKLSRRLLLMQATASCLATAQKPVTLNWDGRLPVGNFQPPANGAEVKLTVRDVRPRPTVSCVDSAERRKLFRDLEKGYSELIHRSNRNAADPTGILYQGRLHGYYCSRTPDVHLTWAFLPWHRAFLYFHEKILQSIVGREFRLPVWEWENCNEVPSFYTDFAAHNLLVAHPSNDLGHQITPCMLQAWLLSKSPDDFLGTDKHFGNANAGPHGLVHSFINRPMAPLSTAAVDPLFYAHHANVDRFWEHWRQVYKFTDDKRWLQQRFIFYDEDGKPVSLGMERLIDPRALGYFYPSMPLRNFIHPYAPQSATFPGSPFTAQFPLAGIRQLLLEPSQAPAGPTSDVMAPGRITGIPAGAAANQYYFVVMTEAGKPPATNSRPVGGFGIFMDHDMRRMRVVATCCFQRDDLQFLLNHGGRVSFYWGPPDAELATIAAGKAQPFGPIDKAEILLPEVVRH